MIILLLRPIRAFFFLVKNNIASTVTVCIASFEAIGEIQRKRLHQSRAAVFSWPGIHEHVDNSCKQRAEYPRHSVVIVHIERGQ